MMYWWEFSIIAILVPGLSMHPCQARPVFLDSVYLLSVVTVDDFNEEPRLPTVPGNMTVGAYYYPWYDGDFHRGQGYLRKFS